MATEFNPGGAGSLNAAVKVRYEANADTNAFTDAEKTKLNGVATGANQVATGTVTPYSGDLDFSSGLGGGGSVGPLLTAIEALTTSADQMIYTTGSDAVALTSLTAFGRSLLDDTDAATARATLGLGSGDNLLLTAAERSAIAAIPTTLAGLSDVDDTAASPSDGNILVYRSAGSDWVLEAKPAAGSNPAIADITDWPAGVDATEVGYLNGVTSAIQTQMDAKAPLSSPTFTGSPLSTTAPPGNNSTRIATTEFVQTAVPAASTTAAGKVELATSAETTTGTDTARAVTPAGLKAALDPAYEDISASGNSTTAMSGKTVRSTGGSATTLTIVADTITRSTAIVQTGAGTLTIAAGAGVTVNPQPGGTLVSAGQHALMALVPVGTNAFVLTGATNAA